ncbi:MAG: metal-dependent hydrolase [Proteobacteria bacterium]|nr:metal-dependent hydrolase [Pseudomonadota bacterium]MDA0982942.1 metal-dependent hydrolase [Pseudomonadota bacterium]
MDTLTHALSGALLARATAPAGETRSTPRRVAAGFFAAAAPDLDFVIGFLGPVEYLLYHRGPTHSVLLAPLWAFPIAWLLAKILREPGGWRALYGVCLLVLLGHIAGDWITSFGTMLLSPLSDWRAGLGVTFIIDLWFSGIILAGLVASAIWYRSRLPSILASAVLVGYVGWQWTLKQEALEFAAGHTVERGLQDARIQAYPRPVSPWNWTVFASDATSHYVSHINLRRDAVKTFQKGDGFVAMLDAPYRPRAQARWERIARFGEGGEGALVRAAFESPALGFFRWFAEAPALDGVTLGGDCVWFLDLRFANPGHDRVPFRFGACREGLGMPWRAYERADGPMGKGDQRPVD